MKYRRYHITESDLRAAQAQGRTWTSVAKELGCHLSVVTYKARTLGLSPVGKGAGSKAKAAPASEEERRRHEEDCDQIADWVVRALGA